MNRIYAINSVVHQVRYFMLFFVLLCLYPKI
jgi:hypothetical protein